MLTIALDNNCLETNWNNRLDRLISIDPLRCNYYKDLSMLYECVSILIDWFFLSLKLQEK